MNVATQTKRGGHALQIHYGARGWRFAGIVDSYTIPSHLGPIPARTTWSGEVCGEVSSEWHLTAVVEGEGASHTVSLPMRPAEVNDAPPGVRAILLYQDVPNPGEDELPFKLWIDEYNPERVPNHSRIEIVPEPLDTCVEG